MSPGSSARVTTNASAGAGSDRGGLQVGVDLAPDASHGLLVGLSAAVWTLPAGGSALGGRRLSSRPPWGSCRGVDGSRAGLCESGLVCGDDELNAVAERELVQEAGDVGLDGRGGDDELVGDFTVGQPAGDEAE